MIIPFNIHTEKKKNEKQTQTEKLDERAKGAHKTNKESSISDRNDENCDRPTATNNNNNNYTQTYSTTNN